MTPRRRGVRPLRTLQRLVCIARAFGRARSGSAAIEVTVIAGLVSTAIVASLGLIAGSLGRALAALGSLFAANG